MRVVLDYQNDQILIDDKPIGLKLSEAKADVVYSGDDAGGVLRVFVPFDTFNVVSKEPAPKVVKEPDLMDSLSEADRFEILIEQTRRGNGRR